MKDLAETIMREQSNSNNFQIGFHKPFSNSIDHLHMHAFELPFKDWYTKYVKYTSFFFIGID